MTRRPAAPPSSFLTAAIALALGACGAETSVAEGRQPGDCSDDADNDGNGLFDCDDPGCMGAPACEDETPGEAGETGNDDETSGGGETGGTGPSEPPVDEPGGPQFLSLGASAEAMTQEESVNISAVLTDPDGIDDLIGGELRFGERVVGSFVTAAQEGAYSLEVAWARFHQVVDLTFDAEAEHEFTAVFFDQSGKMASRSLTLRFFCDAGTACSGLCTDVASDPANCGSCARACEGSLGDEPECMGGRCVVESECGQWPSCREACESAGFSCVPDASRIATCGPDQGTTSANYCDDPVWGGTVFGQCQCLD